MKRRTISMLIVACMTISMLAAIGAPFDRQKNERFCAFNFDFRDCGSTARVLDAVVKNRKNN